MNFKDAQKYGNSASGAAHRKALIKLIQQTGYRHSTWDVFSDFCEMSAISISNAVDRASYDQREA
jgi:hypothetical protein